MNIAPWSAERDYSTVKCWADRRGESFPPRYLLPETGVIISTRDIPRVAGWYTFDEVSKWAHLDLLITNPSNGVAITSALGCLLVRTILEIVEGKGAKICLATTRHPWLTRRAAACGLAPLENTVDHLAWMPGKQPPTKAEPWAL